MSQNLYFDQAGDTIVEVLLSVAIISSMLVGSFAIANKSSTQIRMAQERTEATKLTTTVIEQIKNSPSEFTVSDKWNCYDFNNNLVLPPSSSLVAPEIPTANFPVFNSSTDTNSTFNPACEFAPNNGVKYITFVKYDSAINKFDINTRWDRAGGSREQEIMVYRSE